MSYTRERDEFIAVATAEGLSLDTCRKLLRYSTTLQRLAEAQCNGDYPYNGDRYTVCPKCEVWGVAKSAMRLPSECSECTSVAYGERLKHCPHRICPDCRTQELVTSLLDCQRQVKPIFRGAVLRLQTPGYPWGDDGSKCRGLYVPARVR